MTVLPAPGGATSTPSSWASRALTAPACLVVSSALNTTSISLPGFLTSVTLAIASQAGYRVLECQTRMTLSDIYLAIGKPGPAAVEAAKVAALREATGYLANVRSDVLFQAEGDGLDEPVKPSTFATWVR
jgi:hypothetical protein